MSMLLNSFRFAAAPPAGIQYVGGYTLDTSSLSQAADYTFSLSGVLTGGIASSPQAGDYCVIFYSQGGTADRTSRAIYNAAGAFTQLATQYANDTNDVSMTVAAKFLESPIDFNVTVGNARSRGNAIIANVQVFRGVNVSTPMDVAAVVTSGINGGQPNPGSITPTTSGAVIAVFGAAGLSAAITAAFTSSDLTSFASLAVAAGAGRSLTSGFGLKAWTSGAFDAAQFGGGTTSATDSNVAVALALRPA